MMKQSMSFLKRGLAFVLALLLVVSSVNLSALQVFAETTGISEGKVVANNYDLTQAEKDLLNSGLLIGNTISYTAPADSKLVSVDTDKKEITVKAYEPWVAAKATIKVGEEVKETVAINNGKATYTFAGNAFSVEVTYELYADVDAATQKTLLAAPGYLKGGCRAAFAVSKGEGNLALYANANDALATLAQAPIGFRSEEAKKAALALDAQYAANGGLLDLEVMLDAYSSAPSKVQYVLSNGVALLNKGEETYNYINLIVNDDIMTHSSLNEILTADEISQLTMFRNAMDTWLYVMENVDYTWADEELNPVKAEMSAADWAKLDKLVENLEKTNTLSVKEGKLLVASAAVKTNLSMYNVEVTVKMQTASGKVDDATLVDYGMAVATTVTLPAGATAADIKAAVEATGIITSATSGWLAYEAEHYVVTYGTLPETLEADATYVITYVPKTYTVDCNWQDDLSVPYGYKMTLPKHTNANKVYDYKVDGKYMPEGSVITVTGNVVVNQTEGAPRENSVLMDHVDISKLTDAEKAILTSPAVTVGQSVISIRFPSNEKVTLSEGVLTAEKVLSDYPNAELYWIPTTADVKIAGQTIKTYTLVDGKATIAEADYDQVVVNYTLTLNDQSVSAVKNLPHTLLSEANTQLGQMDKLLGREATLKSVSRGILNTMRTYADGKTLAAVEYILANGINEDTAMLKLYEDLMAYKAQGSNAEKISYYYRHYEQISTQLNMLRENLVIIAADIDFLDRVAKDFGEYADEILEIKDAGDSLNDIELLKPNKALKLSNAALDAVITNLFSGEINEYPAESLKLTHEISKAHDLSRTVTVVLKNSVTGKTVSFELVAKKGNLLNEAAAKAAFDTAFAQLAVVEADLPYYNHTANLAKFAELLATAVSDNTTLNLTWKPNTYTVAIQGTDVVLSTTVVENFFVVLPKHTNTELAYRYYVNGVKVAQGETVKIDINNLPTITREVYNIAQAAADEKFDLFISNLNADSNGAITVVPSADKQTITMTIDGANPGALTGGAESFVMGLIKQVYEQIYLGDDVLVNTDMKVFLQTMVNAIMNDRNFNNKNVANAILNGTPVLTSTMKLCDKNGNVEKTVDLKVVVKNANEDMRKAAKAMRDIEPFFAFQSKHGIMDIELNLPEKVYEAYLAALVMINEIDLDDATAVNTEIATMFLYDYMNYVVSNDAITTQTFMNSLEMMGQNIDLSVYEERYQAFRTIWNDWTDVESKGEYVQADIWAPMNTLVSNALSAEQIDSYKGMLNAIYEYEHNSGIWARTNITLGNTLNDFEAIVIDIDALIAGSKETIKSGANTGTIVDLAKGNGAAHGIDCTTDLIARMSEVTGEAAIYLLDDVDGDLIVNGTTILDLNGHTIKGNVVANGTLIIVDSTIGTYTCGGVTGTVSGNAHIVAGNYSHDVSAFLRDGYKQVDGYVQNALYYFDNANGGLTLVINSDVMYDGSVEGYLPSITVLAADVALDMALNFYIPASISANGAELVGIDNNFGDLLGMWNDASLKNIADSVLRCVKTSGISKLANQVIADLIDVGGIADALENETPVATYTLGTNGWALNLEYIADGDYLTFGIVENEADHKEVALSLVIEGNNIKKLVALLRELDRIIVDEETFVTVDLKRPYRDGKHLVVGGSTKDHLSIDLTVGGTEENYKTILAIAFAYGNPDKAQALVNAMNDDVALKKLFDQMTVREVVNAMEAMNRATSFEEMCVAVGSDINYDAADLESLYHLIVCAAGKVLEKSEDVLADLEIDPEIDVNINTNNTYIKKAATLLERAYKALASYANIALDKLQNFDMNSKLGALDQDNDGTYILSGSAIASGVKTYRGFGVNYELEIESVMLKVKVFGVSKTPDVPDVPDDPSIPDTGDDFNGIFYMTMMAIAPMMMAALIVFGAKKRLF